MTEDDLKGKQIYLKCLEDDIVRAKMAFYHTGEYTPLKALINERKRILTLINNQKNK